MYIQQQITNKINNEDLGNLMINQYDGVQSQNNDEGSFFDNVKLLDGISVDFSKNGSINR